MCLTVSLTTFWQSTFAFEVISPQRRIIPVFVTVSEIKTVYQNQYSSKLQESVCIINIPPIHLKLLQQPCGAPPLPPRSSCVYMCIYTTDKGFHKVKTFFYQFLYCFNMSTILYKTIILPVVLYGCEAWSLTLREERRLSVFENRILR